MSRIWIGTSGWIYKGWRETFYPEKLPQKKWLEWYGTQLNSTEINGSFYRTPSLEAVAAWREQTPDEFLFAWKASKFITHWKRLSDNSRNSLELMETRLKVLGPKLGPVLFQLPPQFGPNVKRLKSFLKLLNRRRKYAFEFRDPAWYQPAVLKLLQDHNISLCLSDHHDAPAPWEVTADHVYIRGHGPTGRYTDRYSPATLKKWSRSIRTWSRKGLTVYCYFDNDQKTAAPHDAAELMKLLNRSVKSS